MLFLILSLDCGKNRSSFNLLLLRLFQKLKFLIIKPSVSRSSHPMVLCNFTEIAFRHGCSPVNLLHIFRTTFPWNNSGWLLTLAFVTAFYILLNKVVCKLCQSWHLAESFLFADFSLFKTIFAKFSILDVLQGPENAFVDNHRHKRHKAIQNTFCLWLDTS